MTVRSCAAACPVRCARTYWYSAAIFKCGRSSLCKLRKCSCGRYPGGGLAISASPVVYMARTETGLLTREWLKTRLRSYVVLLCAAARCKDAKWQAIVLNQIRDTRHAESRVFGAFRCQFLEAASGTAGNISPVNRCHEYPAPNIAIIS